MSPNRSHSLHRTHRRVARPENVRTLQPRQLHVRRLPDAVGREVRPARPTHAVYNIYIVFVILSAPNTRLTVLTIYTQLPQRTAHLGELALLLCDPGLHPADLAHLARELLAPVDALGIVILEVLIFRRTDAPAAGN